MCTALAGLARCYVETGALEQAKQTLALVPEAKRNEAAVAAARAALEVAEQAKSLGPLAELEEKVAADPLNHQARFDLAVALNAKGKREDAVEHLIEIVKRDRKWNDDGARKQLVQFFEAWGATDGLPWKAASVCRRFCSRKGSPRQRHRAAECGEDADECAVSRADRIARGHSGISIAGCIAVAARTDAAQYFRAALSRHD